MCSLATRIRARLSAGDRQSDLRLQERMKKAIIVLFLLVLALLPSFSDCRVIPQHRRGTELYTCNDLDVPLLFEQGGEQSLMWERKQCRSFWSTANLVPLKSYHLRQALLPTKMASRSYSAVWHTITLLVLNLESGHNHCHYRAICPAYAWHVCVNALYFAGFDDSEPGDSDEEGNENELTLQTKKTSGINIRISVMMGLYMHHAVITGCVHPKTQHIIEIGSFDFDEMSCMMCECPSGKLKCYKTC